MTHPTLKLRTASQTKTIRCPQCGVDVPIDKIHLPLRCHARCPLLHSHNLPGSLGLNWTEADKVADPLGWQKQEGLGQSRSGVGGIAE